MRTYSQRVFACLSFGLFLTGFVLVGSERSVQAAPIPPTRCDDNCRLKKGPYQNYPSDEKSPCWKVSQLACNYCKLGGWHCYGGYDVDLPACVNKVLDDKGKKDTLLRIPLIPGASGLPPCMTPCHSVATFATTWERTESGDAFIGVTTDDEWFICAPIP